MVNELARLSVDGFATTVETLLFSGGDKDITKKMFVVVNVKTNEVYYRTVVKSVEHQLGHTGTWTTIFAAVSFLNSVN